VTSSSPSERPDTLFVSGVLLLDKDSGISSNAALQRAKRLLGCRKAGHTGSLDPLASGLLPICLGEATKLAGFLLDTDKRYQVTVYLGVMTASGDAEGEVIGQKPVPELSPASVEPILEQFRGPILQVPPMYSALKHQGRRLYDLARRGIEVERPPRPVEIYELSLLRCHGDRLDLTVHCSKGTYIRSLAEDIGHALGCGGHVESLRRTAVGRLDVTAALTLEKLEQMTYEERLARLEPPDTLVPGLPVIDVPDDQCLALRHGQPVHVRSGGPECGLVRLQSPSVGFFGIGDVQHAGWIAPRRILQPGPQATASRATCSGRACDVKIRN
jgi:tRNA pseudouridine55 synthase